MRVPTCCSTLALVLLLLPAASHAQDPCPEANARATDCALQFCPLTSDPAGCATGVEELASTLTPGGCDPALAEQVQMATCAAVVDLSGAGGNLCEQAYRHIMECVRPRCQDSPDPVCEALLAESSEMPECTAEAAEMSELFLGKSCDELVTMFGL